jgi:hypothetical protein
VIDGDLAGIRREKGGRDGDRLAIDDRVVERKVMTLEAPCPCAAGFRLAEDGGEIGFGIAELGTFFDLTEESTFSKPRSLSAVLRRARTRAVCFSSSSSSARPLRSRGTKPQFSRWSAAKGNFAFFDCSSFRAPRKELAAAAISAVTFASGAGSLARRAAVPSARVRRKVFMR